MNTSQPQDSLRKKVKKLKKRKKSWKRTKQEWRLDCCPSPPRHPWKAKHSAPSIQNPNPNSAGRNTLGTRLLGHIEHNFMSQLHMLHNHWSANWHASGPVVVMPTRGVLLKANVYLACQEKKIGSRSGWEFLHVYFCLLDVSIYMLKCVFCRDIVLENESNTMCCIINTGTHSNANSHKLCAMANF